MAQRLLRRLCESCRIPISPISEDWTDEERRLAKIYGTLPAVRAAGCGSCGNTGYRGRLAVAEVLVNTPKLQELVLRGAGTAQLEQTAIEGGMRRMLDVALEKASAGHTSLAEVERVLGEVREDTPANASMSHALVIDDDPLNRMVVKNLLTKNGFRVSEAADGLEALERLREPADFSLIVLDLEMPRMGGLELLGRLKASVATAGIPVVVLTGSEDGEGEARLIDLGADDYIEKPVNHARFLARVRAMLRRSSV